MLDGRLDCLDRSRPGREPARSARQKLTRVKARRSMRVEQSKGEGQRERNREREGAKGAWSAEGYVHQAVTPEPLP